MAKDGAHDIADLHLRAAGQGLAPGFLSVDVGETVQPFFDCHRLDVCWSIIPPAGNDPAIQVHRSPLFGRIRLLRVAIHSELFQPVMFSQRLEGG